MEEFQLNGTRTLCKNCGHEEKLHDRWYHDLSKVDKIEIELHGTPQRDWDSETCDGGWNCDCKQYVAPDGTAPKNQKRCEKVSRVISKKTRYLILSRQHWTCNNCSERLKYNKRSKWEGSVANIDHIHPFSKRDSYINGSTNINELSNLQALCETCNKKKGAKYN